MSKCYLKTLGGCCCKCRFQTPIYKHPWNKGEGKGSIKEVMGYGCTGLEDSMEKVTIFFDDKHGRCEIYEKRIK